MASSNSDLIEEISPGETHNSFRVTLFNSPELQQELAPIDALNLFSAQGLLSGNEDQDIARNLHRLLTLYCQNTKGKALSSEQDNFGLEMLKKLISVLPAQGSDVESLQTNPSIQALILKLPREDYKKAITLNIASAETIDHFILSFGAAEYKHENPNYLLELAGFLNEIKLSEDRINAILSLNKIKNHPSKELLGILFSALYDRSLPTKVELLLALEHYYRDNAEIFKEGAAIEKSKIIEIPANARSESSMMPGKNQEIISLGESRFGKIDTKEKLQGLINQIGDALVLLEASRDAINPNSADERKMVLKEKTKNSLVFNEQDIARYHTVLRLLFKDDSEGSYKPHSANGFDAAVAYCYLMSTSGEDSFDLFMATLFDVRTAHDNDESSQDNTTDDFPSCPAGAEGRLYTYYVRQHNLICIEEEKSSRKKSFHTFTDDLIQETIESFLYAALLRLWRMDEGAKAIVSLVYFYQKGIDLAGEEIPASIRERAEAAVDTIVEKHIDYSALYNILFNKKESVISKDVREDLKSFVKNKLLCVFSLEEQEGMQEVWFQLYPKVIQSIYPNALVRVINCAITDESHEKDIGPMMNRVGNPAHGVSNHWYSDEEIIVLLTHYIGKHPEVAFLDPMLGTDWGDGNNTLQENMAAYHQKRGESPLGEFVKRRVIIPVNLGGGHWVLVYAIYPEDKTKAPAVYYFNSTGALLSSNQNLNSVMRTVFPKVEIVEIVQECLQFNDDDCGPWIVEAARSIADNGSIPEQGHDIANARSEHYCILNPQQSNLPAEEINLDGLDFKKLCTRAEAVIKDIPDKDEQKKQLQTLEGNYRKFLEEELIPEEVEKCEQLRGWIKALLEEQAQSRNKVANPLNSSQSHNTLTDCVMQSMRRNPIPQGYRRRAVPE